MEIQSPLGYRSPLGELVVNPIRRHEKAPPFFQHCSELSAFRFDGLCVQIAIAVGEVIVLALASIDSCFAERTCVRSAKGEVLLSFTDRCQEAIGRFDQALVESDRGAIAITGRRWHLDAASLH